MFYTSSGKLIIVWKCVLWKNWYLETRQVWTFHIYGTGTLLTSSHTYRHMKLLAFSFYVKLRFLSSLPREGVIIECPLKWQFHCARDIIITSQMAISVLVNNDNDWPLLGSKYQYFWEKSPLLTVYLAQNISSGKMMFF